MKLLIADPFLTASSPTMRGIASSLDAILPVFDEIEVWATECEWDHPKVKWQKVERRFKPWPLHSMYYSYVVGKWLKELDLEDPDLLVQTSGCFLAKTDIRYIQFWNHAFFEESRKRPESLKPDLKTSLLGKRTAKLEAKLAGDAESTREWWVVSRNLAARIAEQTPEGSAFEILPNSYNRNLFKRATSEAWRKTMRLHYEIGADTKVLAFAAFGHFERKGLRQAVETIRLLREQGHDIVLLIFGGKQAAIASFKDSLRGEMKGIVFTGHVDHIEKHLSAADGFFFPSHFEAFSLAEIEAAALGLRLYLTPHYGSEMILREPTNGRLLPWDPPGMAEAIATDIREGLFGKPHGELGEALAAGDYSERLAGMYRRAISRKRAVKPTKPEV